MRIGATDLEELSDKEIEVFERAMDKMEKRFLNCFPGGTPFPREEYLLGLMVAKAQFGDSVSARLSHLIIMRDALVETAITKKLLGVPVDVDEVIRKYHRLTERAKEILTEENI